MEEAYLAPGASPAFLLQGESFEGALCIRGPTVFKEYIGRPEATAAEFDEEGEGLLGE
jgi:long-subunit acyl-CoA synthetase (AMP-forming)